DRVGIYDRGGRARPVRSKRGLGRTRRSDRTTEHREQPQEAHLTVEFISASEVERLQEFSRLRSRLHTIGSSKLSFIAGPSNIAAMHYVVANRSYTINVRSLPGGYLGKWIAGLSHETCRFAN